MERKRNYIEKVQDWADDCLRRMCGRITPGKRLVVILVMFLFFGGLRIIVPDPAAVGSGTFFIWKKGAVI